MTGQQIAVLITAVSHLGAGAILIGMLFRLGGSRPQDSRSWWDDDGGSGRSDQNRPDRSPGGGGIPLADADSSDVRLRQPGRLADRRRRPPRRAPHRRPAPERVTEPVS